MATEKVIKITTEVDAGQLEELGINIQGVEESADSASESISQMGDQSGETARNVGDMGDEANNAGNELSKMGDESSKAADEVKQLADNSGEGAQNTNLLAGAVSTLAAVGIAQFFQDAAESASDYSDSVSGLSIASEEVGVSLTESKKTAAGLASSLGIGGGSARKFTTDLELLGVSGQDTIKGLATSIDGLAFISGSSFDEMNGKFTKIIATGKIMPRAFGTSWGLIEKSIKESGLTVDEWKAKFENATQPERAEMLNEVLGRSAAIQKGAAASAGDLDSNMQRLQNSIGGVIRRLGDPIFAIITPLIQGIAFVVNGLIDAWDNLPQPVKDFVNVLVLIVGAGAGVLSFLVALTTILPTIVGIVGSVATMFELMAAGEILASIGAGGLIPALSGAFASLVALVTGESAATVATWSLTTALWAMFTALLSNPLVWVAIAIIAIVVAIQELGKYMGWWTDWGTMIEAFQAGINRLWAAFVNNEQVKAVIQWLKDAWQSVLDFLQPVFDAIGGFFSDMFPEQDGSFDIVRAIIDVFGLLGEVVGTVVGAVIIPYLQTLWDFWSAVFGFIFPFVFAYLQTLWTVWTTIFGFIFNFVIAYLQTLWTFWTTVFNAIMNIIRAAIGVWNSFKTGVSTVVNAVKGFINGLVQSFQSMKDRVMGYLQPIIDGIKWITGNQDNVKAAGGDFGGGFAFTKYDLNGANAVGSGDTYITNIKQQGIIDKYAVDLINDTRDRANHLNKQRGG